MGLFSSVARVAGKVVTKVGGERGERLVDRAREVRDRVRGAPDDTPQVLPWPHAVSPVWSRGHDLLTSHWPTEAQLIRGRGAEIAALIRRELGPDAEPLAAGWEASVRDFASTWEAVGAQVADAWAQALRAPDLVAAEGLLDGAVQGGWRAIREAWVPVRLSIRDGLPALAATRHTPDESLRGAQGGLEGVWGRTESELSDRFLGGGGSLVSLVREVAEGASPGGELLDAVQSQLSRQEATWRGALDAFEGAWREAAALLR